MTRKVQKTLSIRAGKTKQEIIDTLNQTGKCAILRPTGFGKTVIMCDIAQNYDKVLYVYPSRIIKTQAELSLNGKNIDWISYAWLGRHLDDISTVFKKILGKYNLIIFDEIHHLGAKRVKSVVEQILNAIEPMETNILGGTATPKRMDGYDVIDTFFDNNIISFYGLDSMIEDKLIQKPYYVYAVDNYKLTTVQIKDKINKAKMTQKQKSNISISLRNTEGQIARMLNAPTIIYNAVNKVYNDIPDYMRFMVFFSTKEILTQKSLEIEAWFKTAFAGYNIRTLIIHSDSKEKENIKELGKLGAPSKTIDIILSINMLNEGYHLEKITGCILLRPTKSSTVYTQQVGRCMQVGAKYSPIIIDFVDNLNTSALFGDFAPISNKGNEKTSDEQAKKLNKISPANLHIVDLVDTANKMVQKVDMYISFGTERDIIETRKDNAAPVYQLAKEYKISVWEVMQILSKHTDELEPLGLALCEADRSKTGISRYGLFRGNIEDDLIAEFDSYMKQLN